MPMTLAEKILARKSGRSAVAAGDLLTCRVDKVLATDITAPLSIAVFRRMGAERVFDPKACILINDHFVPAKDIRSAQFSRTMRLFAEEQGIEAYFEVGRAGICHTLVAEKGLVAPGELYIGADSHTCTAGALGAFATGVGSTDLAAVWALGEIWLRVPESIKVILKGRFNPWVTSKDVIMKLIGNLGVDGGRYKALEFCGPLLETLPMHQRLTLCNMTVEAGAKAGMIPADHVTREFYGNLGLDGFEIPAPDEGARYCRTVTVDAGELEPLVAEPFAPDRIK
ncbi:MAG: aconitase family protein, partial [Acidobacteriota bacterium]